jgi:hypothetical protein
MDEEIGVGAGPAERARHAGGDGPAPTRRRRMSAGRKREAVLRLLRGEDLELAGLARARGDRRRAERLARRVPRRRRGFPKEPAGGRPGRMPRSAA